MKKETIIFALGVLVVIVPFLGFPGRWETVLSTFAGIGIVIAISLLHREMKQRPFSLKRYFEERADSFVQNGGGNYHE